MSTHLPGDLIGWSSGLSDEAKMLLSATKTVSDISMMTKALSVEKRPWAMLRLGDLLVLMADRLEMPETLATARFIYASVQHIAAIKVSATWNLIEAAAVYGLAVVDMTEKHYWPAMLNLIKAGDILFEIRRSSLIVDDLRGRGHDPQALNDAILTMREDVFRLMR